MYHESREYRSMMMTTTPSTLATTSTVIQSLTDLASPADFKTPLPELSSPVIIESLSSFNTEKPIPKTALNDTLKSIESVSSNDKELIKSVRDELLTARHLCSSSLVDVTSTMTSRDNSHNSSKTSDDSARFGSLDLKSQTAFSADERLPQNSCYRLRHSTHSSPLTIKNQLQLPTEISVSLEQTPSPVQQALIVPGPQLLSLQVLTLPTTCADQKPSQPTAADVSADQNQADAASMSTTTCTSTSTTLSSHNQSGGTSIVNVREPSNPTHPRRRRRHFSEAFPLSQNEVPRSVGKLYCESQAKVQSSRKPSAAGSRHTRSPIRLFSSPASSSLSQRHPVTSTNLLQDRSCARSEASSLNIEERIRRFSTSVPLMIAIDEPLTYSEVQDDFDSFGRSLDEDDEDQDVAHVMSYRPRLRSDPASRLGSTLQDYDRWDAEVKAARPWLRSSQRGDWLPRRRSSLRRYQCSQTTEAVTVEDTIVPPREDLKPPLIPCTSCSPPPRRRRPSSISAVRGRDGEIEAGRVTSSSPSPEGSPHQTYTGFSYSYGGGTGGCMRDQLTAVFQVSDNKLALKLFGNRNAVLKEKQRQRAGGTFVIHPCSDFRFYWDVCMLTLLIANLIILPVGISFFSDDHSVQWIVFNSISDTVFLLDLAINFRTGIIADNYADEIILDPSEISKRYLKTWFLLDLISSLPLDYLITMSHDTTSGETIRVTQLLHAGRAIKMFRLVKLLSLLRLLRLSRLVRYVSQWEEFISSAAGKFMRIFNLIAMILLLGHWNGCLQFLVPMLQDFPADSWVSIENLTEAEWYEQYTWALFKALSHMLSIGFGRYAPQSTTDVWLTMVSMLTGATCYALFVGHTTTLIQSFDTSRRLYNEKLKQVEEYMISRKLPRTLRRRLTDYYEHRYHGKMFHEESILGELNECLREEVVNFNCRSLVASVPFFTNAEPSFVSEIVTRLDFEVFLPGDLIIKEGSIGSKMYFVKEGVVDIIAKDGTVTTTLGDGSYFGEICLLMKARRVASVQAETFCNLFSLSVDHLYAVLDRYPTVRRTMESVAFERLRELRHRTS